MVTGGAGFISSHVVRLFVNKYPDYLVVNADALTYAGNLENLKDVQETPNYRFERVDITDECWYWCAVWTTYTFDSVVHLAAESHVDRSIIDPLAFIKTNVLGTANLLNIARKYWAKSETKMEGKRFYHVSTDEVYAAHWAKKVLYRRNRLRSPLTILCFKSHLQTIL